MKTFKWHDVWKEAQLLPFCRLSEIVRKEINKWIKCL